MIDKNEFADEKYLEKNSKWTMMTFIFLIVQIEGSKRNRINYIWDKRYFYISPNLKWCRFFAVGDK